MLFNTKSAAFLLLLTLCGTISCVTFKQFDDKAKSAREPGYSAALIKEDGTVITGSALKHRNYDPYDHNLVRVTKDPRAFRLDGKDYSDTDMVGFQDGKAFHKRFNGLYLIRLIHGKINLYYFDNTGYNKTYTFSNGPTSIQSNSARSTSYFFDKDNGGISGIGLATLREAVKDDPAALQKLQSLYPRDNVKGELNLEKLTTVVRLYNQDRPGPTAKK